MKNSTHPVRYDIREALLAYWIKIKQQFTSPWTKLVFLLSLTVLLTQQEFSFGLSMHSGDWFGGSTVTTTSSIYDMSGQNVSLLVNNEAYEPARDTRINDPKHRQRLAYIETYRAAAEAEMHAHGIPASITLAQGLLESGAGQSSLAKKANNHFGIKCFSQTCSRGHCTNFDDDTHKDFFIVYDSPEASYKSHSRVLSHSRYRKLFQLSMTDYKGWAKGLSKAGYATDPKYADKLISLVEEYGLDRYDVAQ
ncbi:MAG: glucosaminidase domain-containing protein [Bacteroidota bacterium]